MPRMLHHSAAHLSPGLPVVVPAALAMALDTPDIAASSGTPLGAAARCTPKPRMLSSSCTAEFIQQLSEPTGLSSPTSSGLLGLLALLKLAALLGLLAPLALLPPSWV